MSDQFFVPVLLSNPVSGLTLYFSEKTKRDLEGWAHTDGVSFGLPEAQIAAGVLLVKIQLYTTEMTPEPSRRICLNGRKASESSSHRVFWSLDRLNRSLATANVPQFTMTPVKLYLRKEADGSRWALATVNVTDLPNKSVRVEADGKPAPPPVPKELISTIPKATVLLSIAGQELSFNVPLEEAFGIVLGWTEKGYKS